MEERRQRQRARTYDTLIYFEISDPDAAVREYGHLEAEWRVREALDVGGVMLGQWYDQAKIVILCTRADLTGLLRRVYWQLANLGVGATWAVVGLGESRTEAVQWAAHLIETAMEEKAFGSVTFGTYSGYYRWYSLWLDAPEKWEEIGEAVTVLRAWRDTHAGKK